MAKVLNQPLTDSKLLTEIGQIIGTLEYMSPEQARGSPVDVDTRAAVGGRQKTVTVTATTATGIDGSTPVLVN